MVEVVAAVYTAWVAAATTSDTPTDIWSWFLANVTLQGTVNVAGLALLVVLFSRDLILTRSQHERRVADIVKNYDERSAEREAAHDDAMQAKDDRYADLMARYAEMKESRDYYREARLQEPDGKREVVEALIRSNEGLQVAARGLAALDQLVPGTGDA